MGKLKKLLIYDSAINIKINNFTKDIFDSITYLNMF